MTTTYGDHLLEKYSFLPIQEDENENIIDFCMNEFLRLEPHCRALNIGENLANLIRWIVLKSLHSPFCLKVVEKSSGAIVAVRIVSVAHRDEKLDYEPYPLDTENVDEGAGKIMELLDSCTRALWDSVEKGVNKILYREISCVISSHQRQGIAQKMLEYGLDFGELRAQGIHGIGSVTTSLANQNLLQKNGYSCIYTPEVYDWKLDDGTKTAKVFFKDIRSLS